MKRKINFKHSDQQLKKIFKSYFAYDLAQIYKKLDIDERKRVLSLIGLEKMTDMFVELDTDIQFELFSLLEPQRRKSLCISLEIDDLKEFFYELSDAERKELEAWIPKYKAKTLEYLLTYDEDLAASIMSTDFITVNLDESIKEATHQIITESKENDYIDNIYIVDQEKKIVGVCDLKSLIMARGNTKLKDILEDDFHFVYEDETIEKAIETVMDYDKNAIPVLDKDDKVIGIITADDIFDEIIEDREFDYQRMALLNEHESSSSAWIRTKQRLPWLMIAVILNLLIALFISGFEATFKEVLALVLFQPLILGMAGNIGTQSLAVTILGLHLKDFDSDSIPKKHVKKEVFVAMFNSLFLGVSALLLSFTFLSFSQTGSQRPIEVAIIVGFAVFVSMFVSALMGVFIPILLNKAKQDPAAASGPILTTINDLVAALVYFGIATIVFL
jgi:magnesium transporter